MGKGRLRSDSGSRMGNAGPGALTTSKPFWGACARVCKKTAVEESAGPRSPRVHDGSRFVKTLVDSIRLAFGETIPKPAEPESFLSPLHGKTGRCCELKVSVTLLMGSSERLRVYLSYVS